MKHDVPLDDDPKVGSDPPPKSARELLVDEIVALQRKIYLLERKLNEMDHKDLEFYHRPPTR